MNTLLQARARWISSAVIGAGLAFGIGTNCAVFSVVEAALIRPFPYPQAEQLVVVQSGFQGEDAPLSLLDMKDYRRAARQLEVTAPFLQRGLTLEGALKPERLRGLVAGAGFLEMLGVRPMLGRTLNEHDDLPGLRSVLIGYRVWQERFGADPKIVGRSIVLDGESYTVVGVLPEGFAFGRLQQFVASMGSWVPPRPDPELGTGDPWGRGNRLGLRMLARLRRDTSVQQAEDELEAIAATLSKEHPQTNERITARTTPLREYWFGNVKRALWLVQSAATCALVLICLNIGALQAARSAERTEEMAVRVSLGATTGVLFSELLKENLVLALAVGSAGAAVAGLALPVIRNLLPERLLFAAPALDWGVLGFALIVSLGVGLIASIGPALVAARVDPAILLKDGNRTSTTGRGRGLLRDGLVLIQVGAALVLVTAALWSAVAARRLEEQPLGFDSRNRLTAVLTLPERRYPNAPAQRQFSEELLRRLKALPGVQQVAHANALPLGGYPSEGQYEIFGSNAKVRPVADYVQVSPEYFNAMAIPLLAGRTFSPADRPGSQRVVIVNEVLAKRFGGRNALGQRLRLETSGEWLTIVGIVGSVRQQKLDDSEHDQIYWPYAQDPWPYYGLVVRTAGSPAALVTSIERTVLNLDRDLPLLEVRTYDEVIQAQLQQPRLVAVLLGAMAVLALLNAALGISGAMVLAVAERNREIGIRLALGATETGLVVRFVGRGIALSFGGIVLGAPLALFVRSAADLGEAQPTLLVIAAMTLASIAAVASYLPTRIALRSEPMRIIRNG